MLKPVVVQTEHLSAEAAAWLGQRVELVVNSPVDQQFHAALARADGLVVRTYTKIDAELLERAPRLKVVGRAGVGLDNIDLAACRARNIQVVSTPDANTQAVVEYVVCLLADALRPRLSLDRPVDSQTWNDIRAGVVGRRQMNELTLGILGLGRVGRRVAEVAKAIGFRVTYHDVLDMPPSGRMGAQMVPAGVVFSDSDIVSIHIDSRPSNRAYVGGGLIKQMRPDVVFINTSRGFVVDNQALASFMAAHTGAQAMLDVHEPEPFGQDYPLLGLPNVRLLPHLASRTETAMNNMSWVVRDIVAVLEGRPPEFPAF